MPGLHRSPLLDSGTVLHDTYEIVRRVGAGGMGEVYEAKHARLPGRFAIKVLAVRVAAGSAEFRRFRREAEIASTLRHPNLVQVVDFNVMPDGAPYLVMEFLDGSDLAQELRRHGRLRARRTGDLVAQTAAALSVAHAAGVVHRDLKPQNVFLVPLPGRGGELVKLVDFGISKVTSSATFSTEPGLLGTPQYMAPEQAHGRAQEVDARTDQFALAAMSYEMLTGRPAFSGDSVPAILFGITNKEPTPVTALAPWLTSEVEAVIGRGLAKEQKARFASVDDFADALVRALARVSDEPVATMRLPHRPAEPIPTTSIWDAGAESGTVRPSVSTARPRRPSAPPSLRRALVVAGGVVVALLAVLATSQLRRVPQLTETAVDRAAAIGPSLTPLPPAPQEIRAADAGAVVPAPIVASPVAGRENAPPARPPTPRPPIKKVKAPLKKPPQPARKEAAPSDEIIKEL